MLLSQHDTKPDVNGVAVPLHEGLIVNIYMDDVGTDGQPDNLVASGLVERNRHEGWAKHVKWCCRIGPEGILHESDKAAKDRQS